MNNMKTDFTIISAPVKIHFECPHCGLDSEVPWRDVDVPECWSDPFGEVECLWCGESVQLGGWEYD